MNPRYPSPGGFRQALEARLRAEAAKRGVPLNDLRQKLVMERLLARLFAEPNPPWLLKGGYAMELRYRPSARTTRDLDLTAIGSKPDLVSRLNGLRQQLQDAADSDAGDYLVFRSVRRRVSCPGRRSAGRGSRLSRCWPAGSMRGSTSMRASAIR